MLQSDRAQQYSLIVLSLCQLFIANVPNPEPFFQALRPVQLPLALERRGELRKECSGLFVCALQVSTQEIERGFTVLCLLDVALGHFRIQTPFGRVCSRLAAVIEAETMLDTRRLQTGPQTR